MSAIGNLRDRFAGNLASKPLKALAASGRFRTTVATWSAIVTWSVS